MYEELQAKVGLSFVKTELYERCFTHRSALNELGDEHPELRDNERLEFLGDAVLELAATSHLFHNYPERDEGELTAWRAALVKGENLAKVGRKLELGQHLRLSKGEEKSGGRSKDYILANTVEALIGAIYLDLGYESAKKVIDQFILSHLEELIASGAHQDAKSALQELSQERFSITPHYECLEASGPDHDKQFTMAAYIGDRQVGTGINSSKQKAEQAAARRALDLLANEAKSDQ